MGLAVDGLASGLDTSNIISKLVELEKIPVKRLEDKILLSGDKLIAWQDLEKLLSSFQSASGAIDTVGEFSSIAASFENSNAAATQTVLTASATSSATSASYTIEVNSIAAAEKEVSQGLYSRTASIAHVGGSIDITVGGTTTSVTITTGNDTLDGVVRSINNSSAEVTASILNDGSSSPYRLLITANNSGASNTISISDTLEKGGIGLPGGISLFSFTETQAGSDASFTIDGVDITRTSNLVTDAIDGVSLNLRATGSGSVKLESDRETVETKVNSIVEAYNNIVDFVDEQFLYDSDSGNTGTLFGNTTLISLQQKLRGIVSGTVPGVSGTFTALAQVGISTNSEGKLEFDSSSFQDALRLDYEGVVNLFSFSTSTPGSNLSYVSKTTGTKGGTYEVQVALGRPQIRTQGASGWDYMEGNGNYWTGTTGNANGLKLRFESTADGSYGTFNVGRGVADRLTAELDFLTDFSYKGLIFSEEEAARKNIVDIQEQIDDLNFRIAQKETDLRTKYTTLEGTMGKLTSLGDYLTQQLAVLNK